MRSIGRARLALLASLAVLAFAPPAAADPGWVGAGVCGGIAPETTQCSTGTHTYVNLAAVEHGFVVGDDYTGTLESRVSSMDHSTAFRCSFERGRVLGYCQSSGSWPYPLVPMTHSCTSYTRTTQTRGGFGTWTCYFVHV